MFHCDAETKILVDKYMGQICYATNLLTESASWWPNGELLAFPVVSQIQRRGRWGVRFAGEYLAELNVIESWNKCSRHLSGTVEG